jgi:ribosomal protein L2
LALGHFIKLSNLNYLILGTNMILKKLALGLQISQLQTNNLINLSRSAGIYSKPLFFVKNYNVILLKSGKKKLFFFFLVATIGRISNIKHILNLKYKAGQNV